MRYVILRHEMPDGAERGLHWDLMLDRGVQLQTWALSAEPGAGVKCAAELLPPHRPAYLEYEGPVSGGRGHVRRWDEGTCELLVDQEHHVDCRLVGRRGIWRVLLRGEPSRQRWTVTWRAECASE